MKNIRRSKRIWEYLLTFLIILALNFLLPRMLPGNPILSISRGSEEGVGTLTQKQVAMYMEVYHLNQSLPSQFFSYLKDLASLNLGRSIIYNTPVITFIIARFPWTLLLICSSLLFSVLLGSILGAVSAYWRDQAGDRIIYFSMLLLSELPSFILGLFLLILFSIRLRLFPLYGAYSYTSDHAGFISYFLDILHHAAMPIFTLTLSRLGTFYFTARNSVITVLNKDYLRTAKAKGLSKWRIVRMHILRNAMLPVATRFFLSMGTMIGGTILVENVFSYPGLGMMMREAVTDRDYPLIQGLFLTLTVMTLLANFVSDIVYRKLDPRIGQLYE